MGAGFTWLWLVKKKLQKEYRMAVQKARILTRMQHPRPRRCGMCEEREAGELEAQLHFRHEKKVLRRKKYMVNPLATELASEADH